MQLLLTGGSGRLGKAIQNSALFQNLLSPSSSELNICDPQNTASYFSSHQIGTVIHSAALARLVKSELAPEEAIQKNIIGTANVVNSILAQRAQGKDIRMIHISTDGVYESTEGNYSEVSPTLPQTRYGWSKLGAECSVNMLKTNFCIIRTRFFDPLEIPFDTAATDLFTSKITLQDLVKHLKLLLDSNYCGTINVGGARQSDYDSFKPFKADIKACSVKDIANEVPFIPATDASMNTSRFQKIVNQTKV